MCNKTPDFEISVKGHSLVTVRDGGVQVNGLDFHSDLRNLSALVDILSDVLTTAKNASRPKLVPAPAAELRRIAAN